LGPYGSVRGARGNSRPYREPGPIRDIGSLRSVWRRADVDGNCQKKHFHAVPRETIETISFNYLGRVWAETVRLGFDAFRDACPDPGVCRK